MKTALIAVIDQIHARDHPSALEDLNVPTLLVCVTYDAQTKEHACHIERLDA